MSVLRLPREEPHILRFPQARLMTVEPQAEYWPAARDALRKFSLDLPPARGRGVILLEHPLRSRALLLELVPLVDDLVVSTDSAAGHVLGLWDRGWLSRPAETRSYTIGALTMSSRLHG